jgi:hypothetical protein
MAADDGIIIAGGIEPGGVTLVGTACCGASL